MTFETLITILTIENFDSDNHCYLTIDCDTGQHSQFLRCLSKINHCSSSRSVSGFGALVRWGHLLRRSQQHQSSEQWRTQYTIYGICCRIYTAVFSTRSLGVLRAPTSSLRPFGPPFGPSASLTSSFAPFGRSGRVTHADVSMMQVSMMHVSMM